MDKRPIGVFDSGLGGLTAVKQLMQLAPTEDIVFFGDTARVPYGTRTADTITKYALEDISFLLSHDVKLVIAACGTVSSTLPKKYSEKLPVPFVGVIAPTAAAALKATKNKKIGILGTPATIKSGSFVREINVLDKSAVCVPKACPMFVPLVENGYFGENGEVTRLIAEEYLKPLMDEKVDTIILGCTHYPIIKDIIRDIVGTEVVLIDSGLETAKYALAMLKENALANESGGQRELYTSDNPEGFSVNAAVFLGDDLKIAAKKADINTTPLSECFNMR